MRHAFADCLLTNVPQWVESDSLIAGKRERWRTKMTRVDAHIAVVADSMPIEELDDRALTAREREVCRLVAEDTPIAEIAVALGCSESTVTTHLANIRAKLGCRTNAGIAVFALRAGL